MRGGKKKQIFEHISFVVSFKESNVSKSYDEDIKDVCCRNGIDFYLWKDMKTKVLQMCRDYQITMAFAVGWKYLIPAEINQVVKNGLIVFHDSMLPRYRGFAPTPTAIMCGETQLGITALRAAESVDSGEVILQRTLSVTTEEYISDIISRQSVIYAEMMTEIIEMARQENGITGSPQDESKATYCIWRDVADCQIDWRLSSEEIYNTVRAVSTPYPGAYCYYCNRKIKVLRAEPAEDLEFAIRQPGKIWQIRENVPEVICGKGMLRILEAKHEDGSRVVFNKVRERL